MLFIAGDAGKGTLIRLKDKTTHRNYSIGQTHRNSTAFCPAEKVVVAFQARSAAFFFAAHTQQPVQRSFTPEQVTSCAVTCCGTYLVAGGQNGSLLSWNLRSGQLLRNFRAHLRGITCVSFSPDNSLVVTASEDSVCKVWSLSSLIQLAASTDVTAISTFAGHTLAVLCCAFLNHGNLVVTGSADKTCRLFDATSAEHLGSFTIGDPVTAVAVSPDDDLLAIGTQNGYLCFHRLSDPAVDGAGAAAAPKEAQFLAPSEDGHNSPVVFLKFVSGADASAGSADRAVAGASTAAPGGTSASSSLLTASENGAVLWYDARSCKLVGEAFPRQRQKIHSCSYLPDSTAGDERKIMLPGLSKNPMDPTDKSAYTVERLAKKPRKESAGTGATAARHVVLANPSDKGDDEEDAQLEAELVDMAAKNVELEELRRKMLKKLARWEAKTTESAK